MAQNIDGWAILELMGHRRLGGKLSQAEIAGAPFIRIDIPTEPPATQFYAPSAVYAITPCGEAEALAVARANVIQPVSRWEMQAQLESKPRTEVIRDLAHDDDDECDTPY